VSRNYQVAAALLSLFPRRVSNREAGGGERAFIDRAGHAAEVLDLGCEHRIAGGFEGEK
jgi:hypothetical protein